MSLTAPAFRQLVTDLARVDVTSRRAVRALQRRARELLAPSEAPLRTGEVAEVFGVDRSTVLLWTKAGTLASTETAGQHRRFERAEVRRYLEASGREIPPWLQAPAVS